MPDCDKLEAKARHSATNFHFADLCRLAECYGFEFVGQRGSHHKYRHPKHPAYRMNFQEDKGKAKAYQVRQLLAFIDDYGKT